MTPNDIIKMACQGNAEAERFCRSWVDFCHTIDELHDRDHQQISDAVMVTAFLNWTVELSGNPFFQTYKAQLIGLIVQSANAWLDSNQREGTERHVLAGFYHEVVFHCAFLTGGWAHLRRVTQECREYKKRCIHCGRPAEGKYGGWNEKENRPGEVCNKCAGDDVFNPPIKEVCCGPL